MIRIVMRDKNLSAQEAVQYAVNSQNFVNIERTGWTGMALNLWGHADRDREWMTLKKPVFDVELSLGQKNLIDMVVRAEKISRNTAIAYFLIFTMDELGYHI